jgi:acetyltransferase
MKDVRAHYEKTPYAATYATRVAGKISLVHLRLIRPSDEAAMVEFHNTLSDTSIYDRYFHAFPLGARIEHHRLARICASEPPDRIVLVAENLDPNGKSEGIIGVGRLNRIGQTSDAEFAVMVSDRAQGRGIGKLILRQLLGIAPEARIQRVIGSILAENLGMQKLCSRFGFILSKDFQEGIVNAEWSAHVASRISNTAKG